MDVPVISVVHGHLPLYSTWFVHHALAPLHRNSPCLFPVSRTSLPVLEPDLHFLPGFVSSEAAQHAVDGLVNDARDEVARRDSPAVDEDADIQIGQLLARAQLPFSFQHFTGEAPAIKTAFHAIETRQFRQDPLECDLGLDMLYQLQQPWIPQHGPFSKFDLPERHLLKGTPFESLEDENIGVVVAEDRLRDLVRGCLRVPDDGGLDPRCEHNGIASRLPVPPGLLPLAVQGLLVRGMLDGGDAVPLLRQGADQLFDENRLARVRISVDADDHPQPP